ncbi:MAG: VWA domain-containing protein [Sulfurovum sp.]|nr:VWA domain-containing protein [Sulfurovum sp.]
MVVCSNAFKVKRRIDIAKEVLIKACEETIPAQTLVALRVFGHKKADACRTDLEVRLQALNVKKMTKILKKIKAKNLAKTPIAASLAKVAQDLSSAKGKKVIILVTDGKETCEGNASKEIENLKALGIDVRLNIVGFAIEDKALKKEFETWAKLGNGAYFEANDKKSLEDAVKKALQVPYAVYDLDNELLARGIVGDNGLKLKGGY